MNLSLQFFGKETDNDRLTQHGQEQRQDRQSTSKYMEMEIEVEGIIYPVCLHLPSKDKATASEIIKNLIDRNTISCETLAKKRNCCYNEDSLNRFGTAGKENYEIRTKPTQPR